MSPKSAETFRKKWEELYKEFKRHSDEHDKVREDEASKQKKDFLVRLRRSISWLKRAQQMGKESKGTGRDLDTQFIFLWISFNALYARDPHETLSGWKNGEWVTGKRISEMDWVKKYFGNLLKFDRDAKSRIYNVIDDHIKKQIISLTDNRFVWADFWKCHHDIHRKLDHRCPIKNPRPEIIRENTSETLDHVFGCLYILRNQLMHGSATSDGGLNQGQLRDSIKILHWLVPVFIEIMLENPDKRWGRAHFPRVENVPIEMPRRGSRYSQHWNRIRRTCADVVNALRTRIRGFPLPFH